MLSPGQPRLTAYNWCDYHEHRDAQEKEMWQRLRFTKNLCGEHEDFYAQYFLEQRQAVCAADPDTGAYEYADGYWF